MADEGLVPAQDPVVREREELSGRLKMLREATGKSQREFAEVLGVDHSTVSVYEKPDGRVPDLAYIDGFLAEVASRTDVTADVRKDTRDAYGRLLRLLCDRPQERGRTHGYRQMLRVYELTLEREALTAELADVRQQQLDAAAELASLQDTGAEAATDRQRQQRLEESAAALEQRRAELARRRQAVVSDLDAYQASRPPETHPVGVPPQQMPELPSPQRNTPPHARTQAIVAGAVVIAVLGGWLIYRMTGSDEVGQPQTSPTPVVVVTTMPPGTGSPKPGPDPSPSPTKTAAPKSELMTDLDPVAQGDDYPTPNYLRVGSAVMDTVHYGYGHAFIFTPSTDTDYPSGYPLPCGYVDGFSEYNLDRAWKKLTMVAGVSDTSPNDAAEITVSLDGKVLFKERVSVGKPAHPSLDVANGLRLRITFKGADPDSHGCDLGNVVIGNPTLTR
ncbi:helix-turn-helix domain-containing protein [Streptomyces longwoodensis]|uniref:helix-turn-helix domain-containing protein n=1 Tax=Streptomyces longwoodensis TaxID=68231 RepID=UPI0033D03C59